MIIVYRCPDHGDLVEFDPPGPEAAPNGGRCWARRRIPNAIHTIACDKRLDRVERENES